MQAMRLCPVHDELVEVYYSERMDETDIALTPQEMREAQRDEAVAHVLGQCEQWCGQCDDVLQIRSQGIENVNLFEDYCQREMQPRGCICCG